MDKPCGMARVERVFLHVGSAENIKANVTRGGRGGGGGRKKETCRMRGLCEHGVEALQGIDDCEWWGVCACETQLCLLLLPLQM